MPSKADLLEDAIKNVLESLVEEVRRDSPTTVCVSFHCSLVVSSTGDESDDDDWWKHGGKGPQDPD